MIFTLISIFILIGLLSYYIIFSRIKLSSFENKNTDFSKPVSIVICAKNELKNIKLFFPSWINQNYSEFELIIVNDQSTDGSLEYLKELEKKHANLKVVHIANESIKSLKGKRHALYEGIQAAENKYLLFTDGDCMPVSENWIIEMTKAFSHSKTEIVLGYGAYKREKGFLNTLIQFETILTALQYFGFAEAGIPYMSVGRNVAYKKSILTEKVFLESNKSISGDDDLVFQQLATKENTAYTLSKNAITISEPASSFKEWFLQKKRHLKAGYHYTLKIKLLLGLFVFLNISFYFLIFELLIHNLFFNVFIIVILKTLIYRILLFKKTFFKFENSISIFQFVIIDLIYWFFYIIFVLALKL